MRFGSAFGFERRRRGGVTGGGATGGVGTLGALNLSATSFLYGTPASGTITGASIGSTVAATGLPAGLTINGPARTWAWDGTGSASTGSLTLTETLAGFSNSPRANVIGYTIRGAPAGTLGALSLSASALVVGTPASGTIIGATVGSAIAATGLPGGLTINGAARTWSWDGTGAISSGSLTLTETLAGYTNSPHANVIGYTIIGGLTAPGFLVWNGAASVTSAVAIADPPGFDFTIPDSSEGEADIVEQQVDSVNTFNSADLLTEERVLLWDGTNFEFALTDLTFTPQNFTTQTGLNPAKHWYVRRRFRRDFGDASVYSGWTVVDFTLSATGITFAWNPANKSTWDPTHQTLSNSNRTWLVTTAASGANSSIRSTLNITGNGTKVYFEFNVDIWDTTGSAGDVGLATDTYGGTSGSLASVGDALANLSQTAWLQGHNADLYVANSFVATPAGIDLVAGHAIGFAVRVNASDMTLWVLDNGVCGHGDPVAGTGGYTLPFTQLKPVVAMNPNSGTNQGVTINTLAAATGRAPSGFTPAGA